MKTKKNKLFGFFRRVSALVLLIAIIAFLFYLAFPSFFQSTESGLIKSFSNKPVVEQGNKESLADTIKVLAHTNDSLNEKVAQPNIDSIKVTEKTTLTDKKNLVASSKDQQAKSNLKNTEDINSNNIKVKTILAPKKTKKVFVRRSSSYISKKISKNSLKNNSLKNIQSDDNIYILSYKKDAVVLNSKYKMNQATLKKMDIMLMNNKKAILTGQGHISIVAYLPSSELDNLHSINNQSMNSNIVRTYIMKKYKIPVEHFTFAFEAKEEMTSDYNVGVSYSVSPILPTENQKIYYTFSKNAEKIEASIKRYGILPINRSKNFSETKPQSDGLLPLDNNVDTISKTGIENQQITESHKQSEIADSVALPIPKFHKKFLSSFFGIKSNLLYWAGAIPGVNNKHMTPNLELECYFAKRYSLNINGLFAYWPDKSSQDLWGISTVSVEPRFWYTNDGFYQGAYIGAYGMTGDFDEKFEKISDGISRTGKIYEGGLSLGYYFPVNSRLGFDLGLRCGYRKISGDIYEHHQPDNYYQVGTFDEKGFKLTGIRFSVSYRIGKLDKTK